MKKLKLPAYILFTGAIALGLYSCSASRMNTNDEMLIGKLSTGASLSVKKSTDGNWGMFIEGAGLSSSAQPGPVQIEVYRDSTGRMEQSVGYQSITRGNNGFTGKAVVKADDASFYVVDEWTIEGPVLHLDRSVTVSGNRPGGFLSGITFSPEQKFSRADVKLFAPGMMYGGTDHLTDEAIGGSMTYESGEGEVWIREDRLPAPLFGIYFEDGSSIAILDPEPVGTTTPEDALDKEIRPLIDERFQFGAIGAQIKGGNIESGYRFPGSEGEVTYEGSTYPHGQVHKWRLRYHPVKDGLAQNYQIDFRFGQYESFTAFYDQSWRWAWKILDPPLEPHDIDQVRRRIINMLAERVEIKDHWSGIPHFLWATPQKERNSGLALMGFTGKNIESANFLLQEALNDSSSRGERLRKLGAGIIDSFTRIEMAPPAGEGFNIKTGKPAVPRHRKNTVYLRCLSDGFKSLMKAIQRERDHGIPHPQWLDWAREFGDWLRRQQYPNGGFPRSWNAGTGEIIDPSPHSSYNPVPFLVLLSEETGEEKYLEAALRAGEFSWNNSQEDGQFFIGGTIDNPDVIDKEAGTLSLEAYLLLYEETSDEKWLERAKRAGNFAETWIYIWDVPMPEKADNDKLHWKKGASTTGLQLISTGHSLVDEYMSFDVDEFARLYKYTGDPHYREVAQLLLHNTKSMLALPGRIYDLKGPGWQQEHWSLAPFRGYGIHRGWLPWVSTSQLNGIFGLMEFDPELFRELTEVNKEQN